MPLSRTDLTRSIRLNSKNNDLRHENSSTPRRQEHFERTQVRHLEDIDELMDRGIHNDITASQDWG